LLNFRQDGLGYTKTGFPQASDCFVEFDQPRLIGIDKDTLRPLRVASFRPASSSISTTPAPNSLASAIA
jgi:hypothetical protein